jgi:hypothetical protein
MKVTGPLVKHGKNGPIDVTRDLKECEKYIFEYTDTTGGKQKKKGGDLRKVMDVLYKARRFAPNVLVPEN